MPDLFPYQKTGRDFLLKNQRCMLGDQPGLGKTAQSLTALNQLNKGLRVCIICPRTAIANWEREIHKWRAHGNGHRFLITNYEQLVFDTADARDFEKHSWDVVIIDEAHRLKNVGAKRTQKIYRHVFRSGYVWLLTGTPARNHAGELWTHIRALRPDLIKTASNQPMELDQFEAKYCRIKFDQRGNRQIAGSKNMGELRKLMEDNGFFLRRLKKDVLPELPDLIFDIYPIYPDPNSTVLSDVVLSKRVDEYFLGGLPTDDELLEFLQNPPPDFPLSSYMEQLGVVKAPLVADFVREELEASGKIIVFYKHTRTGDVLKKRLIDFKPARIDGKTKDPSAQEDMFMTDPKCRVFLGQIQSCQEAINLTEATQCLFAETSWSPADNEQAACRGHRIGMQPGYVVRFTLLTGSMDEIVMRVLQRKTEELYQLFG